MLRGGEEYRDIPEDARGRVYPLNEGVAGKTVALLDRARNEPRDLYDLWSLTAGGHVPGRVRKESSAKEARYKKLWQVRLAAQMAELPEPGSVYREVRRGLRQTGLGG